MRRGLGTLVAVALIAGCGGSGGSDPKPKATPKASGSGCRLVGCSATATIRFAGLPRGPLTILICVERRGCMRNQTPGEGTIAIGALLPDDVGETVRVTVIVRRRDGRLVARDTDTLGVRVLRPNGADCPPVCRIARGRFSVPLRKLMSL